MCTQINLIFAQHKVIPDRTPRSLILDFEGMTLVSHELQADTDWKPVVDFPIPLDIDVLKFASTNIQR